MDDRELLESAARAAGIAGAYEDSAWGPADDRIRSWGIKSDGDLMLWNPLTNDGDALRLAVKLGITAEWRERMQYARAAWGGGSLIQGSEPGIDEYAATRLAIVRAAAKIGEKVDAPPIATEG